MSDEPKIKDIATLAVATIIFALHGDKAAEDALSEAKHFIEKAEKAIPGIFNEP